MAKHPNFRPFVGSLWIESPSDDELILNELERLKLSRYLRQSKTDLTIYGRNKRLVLRHVTGQAILVWEKQYYTTKKYGIRCVLFINNSQKDSKDLLKEAMKLARLCWIEYPFFVQVDPRLHLMNAEKIFVACGWEPHAIPVNENQIYTSNFGL